MQARYRVRPYQPGSQRCLEPAIRYSRGGIRSEGVGCMVCATCDRVDGLVLRNQWLRTMSGGRPSSIKEYV